MAFVVPIFSEGFEYYYYIFVVAAMHFVSQASHPCLHCWYFKVDTPKKLQAFISNFDCFHYSRFPNVETFPPKIGVKPCNLGKICEIHITSVHLEIFWIQFKTMYFKTLLRVTTLEQLSLAEFSGE